MIRRMNEFFAALDELPKGVEQRMLRAALRKGAEVFRNEIRKNIDGLTISEDAKKRLKKAIVIRTIRRNSAKGRETRLGIFLERHEDEEGKDAWWAHTIERGTAERSHKTGHITGFIAPQPFIAPAIDAAMATAQQAIDDELAKQWQKEIARMGKAGKW